MASKSKRARQAAVKAKSKSAWPVIIWALIAAYAGYPQNRYGQFSDIRGFFGMRFMDGQNHWPYDPQTRADGSTLLPIEYPAITGVAIWLLTFITPSSGIPLLNYFGINVFIHALFPLAPAITSRSSRITQPPTSLTWPQHASWRSI